MGTAHHAHGLVRDVRQAFRAIKREPRFYGLAMAIVGVGVGACTAVFSVLNPLMLTPLPFEEPEALVWIANSGDPSGGMSAVTSRSSNLRDFRDLNRSFTAIAGYNAFFTQGSYNLTGDGQPEKLVGVDVTQDFLDVLGVRPLHGRNFVTEEAAWGGRPAVILSHAFWTRRYAADASIVGTSIDLNNEPTHVAGVLPPTFDFASIFVPGTRVDFLLPWPVADETDRFGNTLSMIGRLRPGLSAGQAQADLDAVVARLQEAQPERWGLGARVTPLPAKVSGPHRSGMLLLAAAAGTVMLIVSLNLSILLLAKGSARLKEMALRSGLGASRARLLRKLIVESVVLTLGGSVLGVAIAYGATRLVAENNSLSIPLLSTASVDGAALLFTLGLTVAVGVLVGIVPALQATGASGSAALGRSDRGSSAGRQRARLREALVVSEVAMTAVLLVLGGLFLTSFRNVLDVELGFEPTQAVGWTLSPSREFASDEEANAFIRELADRMEAIPGVEEVGLIDALPLERNRQWGTIRAPDAVYEDEEELQGAFPHLVDDGYLAAMQIPLLAGRRFTMSDTPDGPPVVILNESAAAAVFQGRDPIGRTALIIGREWEVVGVVADVRHQSLEQGSGWEMYFPLTQVWDSQTVDMVVRSTLPLESLVPAVTAELRAMDPGMPTREFQSLEDRVDRSVSPRRFVLLLLTGFGGLALFLAAIGIYGVLSYTVNERIPEIGIRMALGESGVAVRRRVVGKTLGLAGLGVVIGSLLSFVSTRSVGSLLYGVAPTDPIAFIAMMVLLLTIAGLAGYLPARRASRVDPMTAFRST
ncbi:MAG: ABC transporter permease [Gemmatimonadetes bacterium]|nr:ABC transporter permease [Gemmatimonadota bacterium]